MPDDLMFYVLQGGKWLTMVDLGDHVNRWMVICRDVQGDYNDWRTLCGSDRKELLEDMLWFMDDGSLSPGGAE